MSDHFNILNSTGEEEDKSLTVFFILSIKLVSLVVGVLQNTDNQKSHNKMDYSKYIINYYVYKYGQ